MTQIAEKTAQPTRLRLPFDLSKIAPGPRTMLCALFALAFAIVSASLSLFLRATSPEPHIDMLTHKLTTLAEQAEEFDTIFLGTSRTLYHIVPEEVEAAAAEAGCPAINAFNLGVYGMTGSEQDWVLRRVLETRSNKLQRIIIEPPLPEYRHVHEIMTNRSRFFHGPDNHADAMKSLSSYGESLPKRIYRAGIYALGVAYDLSGVGRAAERVLPPPPGESWPPMSMAEDGFEALDEQQSADIEARHQEFLDDPGKVDYQLGLYGNPSPNIDARASYMTDKLRAIAEAGIEPALFISPDFMELDRTPQTGETVRAQMPDASVLNFNRPDIYPGLFETNLWHDFSHYNRDGATKLSRAVGAELCRSISAQQQAGASDAVR